jgi:hypothetical protein
VVDVPDHMWEAGLEDASLEVGIRRRLGEVMAVRGSRCQSGVIDVYDS